MQHEDRPFVRLIHLSSVWLSSAVLFTGGEGKHERALGKFCVRCPRWRGAQQAYS